MTPAGGRRPPEVIQIIDAQLNRFEIRGEDFNGPHVVIERLTQDGRRRKVEPTVVLLLDRANVEVLIAALQNEFAGVLGVTARRAAYPDEFSRADWRLLWMLVDMWLNTETDGGTFTGAEIARFIAIRERLATLADPQESTGA